MLTPNTLREEIKYKNAESKFNSSGGNTDKGMVDTSPNAFRGGCHCQRSQLVNYKVQSSVQG